MKEENKTKRSDTELLTRLKSISTGAIIERFVVHPLDNVVSHKQLQPKHSINYIIKDIYSQGKIRALYSGLSWPLLTSIPGRVMMFGSYQYSKDFLSTFLDNNACISIGSGVISGFTEAVVASPAEASRVRKTFNIKIKNGYQHNMLYKGFFSFFIRCSAGNTIVMGGSDWIINHTPEKMNSQMLPFFAGALSGGLAQIATTPVDVVKTRAMKDLSHKSYMEYTKEVWQNGSFFSSLGIRMARQAAGFGIMVGVMNFFKDSHDNKLGGENSKQPLSP